MTQGTKSLTVGVLALQGAFTEHLELLRQAADVLNRDGVTDTKWDFIEVRTVQELAACDGLIIPGGESTTISLVAARSDLLEPLRDFVKYAPRHPRTCGSTLTCITRVHRKPTWGTCAGLILLAESANRTKKGGQELIGGLDVRVNRNHFGRQVESFVGELDLPFLSTSDTASTDQSPFKTVFIRAPVVERVLPRSEGIQRTEANEEETIVAPSKIPASDAAKRLHNAEVEVLARLPGQAKTLTDEGATATEKGEEGDIIAVKQGNVFGISFHPELSGDPRIHMWWLKQILAGLDGKA